MLRQFIPAKLTPPQSSSFGRGCDSGKTCFPFKMVFHRLNLAHLAEDATADSQRCSIAESCIRLCDHLIPALQKDTGKTSKSLHISLIFNKHERKYRHMEDTSTLAAFTRDRICCQKSKKVFPMAEER